MSSISPNSNEIRCVLVTVITKKSWEIQKIYVTEFFHWPFCDVWLYMLRASVVFLFISVVTCETVSTKWRWMNERSKLKEYLKREMKFPYFSENILMRESHFVWANSIIKKTKCILIDFFSESRLKMRPVCQNWKFNDNLGLGKLEISSHPQTTVKRIMLTYINIYDILCWRLKFHSIVFVFFPPHFWMNLSRLMSFADSSEKNECEKPMKVIFYSSYFWCESENETQNICSVFMFHV